MKRLYIMALIDKILHPFAKNHGRFAPGDHVQTHKEGPLMIVQWIEVDKRDKSVILHCKWFDSETKSNRTNIFSEDELIAFDWHNQ